MCQLMSFSFQGQLTFTIGSVENFERNLEAVQQEMNIDPAYWVPVTYVRESEWLYVMFTL